MGEAITLNPASPAPARLHANDRLWKAAKEFEALFMAQMFAQMRKTVPVNPMFGGGKGEEIFRDLLDQQVAQDMVEQKSFGLAEQLYRQFSRA